MGATKHGHLMGVHALLFYLLNYCPYRQIFDLRTEKETKMSRAEQFQRVIYWINMAVQATNEAEKVEFLRRAEEARREYLEWDE